MQRITATITDEQATRLRDEQRRSGAPVSLQVRRALDSAKRISKRSKSSNEVPLFGNEVGNAA